MVVVGARMSVTIVG